MYMRESTSSGTLGEPAEMLCTGWMSDPQSFAKVVADHYLRTEYPALAGQAQRIECPSNKSCEVTYPKASVMVSFVKLPDFVIARRLHHPTGPRCEYDFRCLATGRLVLTKRGCRPS